MTRIPLIAGEALIAFAAGGLAWAIAPLDGVQVHWSPDATEPWLLASPVYALCVLVIVVVLGRVLSPLIAQGSERAERPWRIECAAGVLCVAFAGIQRVDSVSVLWGLAVALVLGLASYSATSKLS